MSNNFMYIMSAIACLNLGFTIAVLMTLRSCVKFLDRLQRSNSISEIEVAEWFNHMEHIMPNRFVSYNGDAGKLYRKEEYNGEK